MLQGQGGNERERKRFESVTAEHCVTGCVAIGAVLLPPASPVLRKALTGTRTG